MRKPQLEAGTCEIGLEEHDALQCKHRMVVLAGIQGAGAKGVIEARVAAVGAQFRQQQIERGLGVADATQTIRLVDQLIERGRGRGGIGRPVAGRRVRCCARRR